jgi:hypothetical protein
VSLASSKDHIEDFLRDLREKIRAFDIAFRPRDKNNEALRILDISPLKRIEFLKGLTYKDYFSGPNKDTYDSDKPDYYLWYGN